MSGKGGAVGALKSRLLFFVLTCLLIRFGSVLNTFTATFNTFPKSLHRISASNSVATDDRNYQALPFDELTHKVSFRGGEFGSMSRAGTTAKHGVSCSRYFAVAEDLSEKSSSCLR